MSPLFPTPMTNASDALAPDSRPSSVASTRRGLYWFGGRLALAVGSLFATVLLLEFGVRAALHASPQLHHVRDGVYFHSMPLVNGLGWATEPTLLPGAETLARRAEDNELRVFVFGESSVQGNPWGVEVSPPAMLHDLLVQRFPDRRVTVVNLGLGGAMMLDTYYFLLETGRYRPDVVVFYQGTNDNFVRGTENCALTLYPKQHRAWRWLARHSRLLLAIRARGPAIARRNSDSTGGSSHSNQWCSVVDGYDAWTRVLVDAATRTGAEVVVATPVHSVFDATEARNASEVRSQGLASFVDDLQGTQRDLARCALDRQCSLRDLTIAAVDVGVAEQGPGHFMDGPGLSTEANLAAAIVELDALHSAWSDAAHAHGATVVDFWSYVREREPGGIPMPPLVVDPVHLSLGGYAQLAQLVADAIESVVTGQPIAPAPAPGDPAPDVSAYVQMMDRRAGSTGAPGFCARSRVEGARWLSVGAVIFGAGLLQEAWDTCQDDAAGVALAWLYERFDLAPDLPDDVVARASSIDIEAHLAAASQHF